MSVATYILLPTRQGQWSLLLSTSLPVLLVVDAFQARRSVMYVYVQTCDQIEVSRHIYVFCYFNLGHVNSSYVFSNVQSNRSAVRHTCIYFVIFYNLLRLWFLQFLRTARVWCDTSTHPTNASTTGFCIHADRWRLIRGKAEEWVVTAAVRTNPNPNHRKKDRL